MLLYLSFYSVRTELILFYENHKLQCLKYFYQILKYYSKARLFETYFIKKWIAQLTYFSFSLLFSFFNFIKMQGLSEQTRHLSQENPEPFIILKNVRKQIKKKQHHRKQSYQLPTTSKKSRKMTLQISHARSSGQEEFMKRSWVEDFQIEQQHQNEETQKKQEQNINMDEGEELNDDEEKIQLQKSIPFNCNQWQLDKQSPYLKSFSNIDEQINELKLDN